MDKFKTGVIGADKRAGKELVRLLLSHPMVELVGVSAEGYTDKSFTAIEPQLIENSTLKCISTQALVAEADIVFNADSGVDAQEIAALAIKNRCVFIDLGPAFRLTTEDNYNQWYGNGFSYPRLHEVAAYALPELMRDALPAKVIAACPGPIATAALLALVPLIAEELTNPDTVIIDAKLPAESSAALNMKSSFESVSNTTSAFISGMHPETPEIEQMLGFAAGRGVQVVLSSSIVPVSRGLFVSCYIKPSLSASEKTIRSAYERYYQNERLIRICNDASAVSTRNVEGTCTCEIGASCSLRGNTLIINSALDERLKGSAAQAVQAMNAMLSLPVDTGIY